MIDYDKKEKEKEEAKRQHEGVTITVRVYQSRPPSNRKRLKGKTPEYDKTILLPKIKSYVVCC